VFGTVRDSQGAVVPGATVTLTSETKGTKLAPAITTPDGNYVFPGVTPDVYSVEITLEGFKTLIQQGIRVSGGERLVVPTVTLSLGGRSEVVEVKAEAPVIQAASGERSFVVQQTTVENIPLPAGRNFAALATLVPGVVGTTRQGGGGFNNIMMDGVSTMDTGNNGQLLQMNVESIAEVKVLTSGYQAEFGRSSGLQISAVTKSGTNRFHGSVYDIKRDNKWNENSWANEKNGIPNPVSEQSDWGYSVGGPVGKPGGNNKLFFFYAQEYRPRNTGGTVRRFRVPTQLERQGDFSQTLDNNGALFNLIRDATTGLPCTSANTSGCFQDGGVLGKIPANRLYGVGLNILKMWPIEANLTQAPGTNYNYQTADPEVFTDVKQPAIRMDYQFSPKLRITAKYSGQFGNANVQPGSIPGFNDVQNIVPWIHAFATTVNYNLNETTFLEGTYGWSQNQLGTPLVTDASNRNNIGLGSLPRLYPEAGVLNPEYYEYKILSKMNAPFFVNGEMQLPPNFTWGNRIGSTPPNLGYPSFLNINRTMDIAVSLTKVKGRHTMKAGFYNNHSYKAENLNTGTQPATQGDLNFGNNANNPLDTGFGYANAAIGVFDTYAQQSTLVEGGYVYNSTEGYIQDNWKVNSKLTLDYGARLIHMQPQYDKLLQTSTFFPEEWNRANAPVLYVPACIGASPCTGNSRNAMNPTTGEILTIPGIPNTAAAIGTIIRGSGDLTNGIHQAGQGISKYGYTWPALAVAPRGGAAYDVSGNQRLVIRGGAGLFYDRPHGDSMLATVGNPPYSTSQTVRSASLLTLGAGNFTTQGAPQLLVFDYDADLVQSFQWNTGVQMMLPWSSSLDVALVGQYGTHQLSGLSNGAANINAIDFGAAFLPQNQDSTLAPGTVPGATALPTDLLRPYRGYGAIFQNQTRLHNESESIQTSFNRRFKNGFSFGLNYTYGIRFRGNTGTNPNNSGLTQRYEHAADGSFRLRADQKQWEELMGSGRSLNMAAHVIKGNWVWDLPNLKQQGGSGRILAAILNDWQISGILTAGSGARYTPTVSYQNGGSSVNLTGSPDYGARIVILGDTGSGCSDNQYKQFTVESFTGPQPGSLGLESGQNYMVGCPDRTVDLSLQRSIRLGGSRSMQFRLDAFNAFNVVVYNARQAQLQLNSPTDLTVRNPQYVAKEGDTTLAPGATGSVLNSTRLLPNNAGFGAVSGAQNLRNLQAQIRFQF
jgi:hypothetical protein